MDIFRLRYLERPGKYLFITILPKDPITGEKILLPSREDSFERLLEVTQQFEDGYTNVEGEVLHKIEVETLHKVLEQLKQEEKELIWSLYFEGISEVELKTYRCGKNDRGAAYC